LLKENNRRAKLNQPHPRDDDTAEEQQLFVGCRNRAELLIIDTGNGKEVDNVDED